MLSIIFRSIKFFKGYLLYIILIIGTFFVSKMKNTLCYQKAFSCEW